MNNSCICCTKKRNSGWDVCPEVASREESGMTGGYGNSMHRSGHRRKEL